MTYKVGNLIEETATNPGQGDFVLNGAAASFLDFLTQIGANNTHPYVALEVATGRREWGGGTFKIGANRIERTTPRGTSDDPLPAGVPTKLDFSGTVTVYLGINALDILHLNDQERIQAGTRWLTMPHGQWHTRRLSDGVLRTVPRGGRYVMIEGAPRELPSTLDVTNGGLAADQEYYKYAKWNPTTKLIEVEMSTTGYVVDPTNNSGVLTKSGDPAQTCLAKVRMSSPGANFIDDPQQRKVRSIENQGDYSAHYNDNTQYSFTNTTIAEINTANRAGLLSFANEVVKVTVDCQGFNTIVNNQIAIAPWQVGIGQVGPTRSMHSTIAGGIGVLVGRWSGIPGNTFYNFGIGGIVIPAGGIGKTNQAVITIDVVFGGPYTLT